MSGVKGKSGRKGAYRELADAETLHRMYFETPPQEEIEEKIRAGKATIKDRHILTALEGDVRAINTIFNKVFPDTTINKHEGEVTAKIIIVDE